MVSSDIGLEIICAERRESFGSRRSKGTFVLFSGSDTEERIPIPAAVARSFKRKIDSDEITIESRAEALWHLGEISRSCAIKRMENLLNRRDYAEEEMAAKLREDGYSNKTIDEVIQRAKEGKALDDSRFAEIFVRSKLNASWGRLRIERELKLRGIEPSSIEGWPEEFIDIEAESDRAYEIASRRRLTGTNDYAKLMRFLLSRGFSASEAKPAVMRILSEQ